MLGVYYKCKYPTLFSEILEIFPILSTIVLPKIMEGCSR